MLKVTEFVNICPKARTQSTLRLYYLINYYHCKLDFQVMKYEQDIRTKEHCTYMKEHVYTLPSYARQVE